MNILANRIIRCKTDIYFIAAKKDLIEVGFCQWAVLGKEQKKAVLVNTAQKNYQWFYKFLSM
ncbi:hypothetical protein [Pedobacter metabolipauper]|uniref:hypothetical protein n=1 Tax=Pedobacter metabolipauper TaxID=425513 RepID=UPI00105E0150|nr:hypothetical protein [Pedobacter metabolipauper]